MEPRFNLWIEHDDNVVLSPWRVALLEAIHSAGSISAAADRLDIPYRRAWEKVQEIESGLGYKVVDTAVGGAGGGGAQLTPAGQDAIDRFRNFAAGFEKEVQQRFEAAFGRAGAVGAPTS